MWLLRGLVGYLTYSACLALYVTIFLHIWPVEMASQSMGDLGGGFMAKGVVDLIQNLACDFVVASWCNGNTQADLILLSVVDDVRMSSIA